jgi:hypothetical protein
MPSASADPIKRTRGLGKKKRRLQNREFFDPEPKKIKPSLRVFLGLSSGADSKRLSALIAIIIPQKSL